MIPRDITISRTDKNQSGGLTDMMRQLKYATLLKDIKKTKTNELETKELQISNIDS